MLIYQSRLKSRKAAYNSNNNNDFLCVNTIEDQAQLRDKTNGLCNPVIVKQSASCRRMNEGARKLRRIGSIKEVGFLTPAE